MRNHDFVFVEKHVGEADGLIQKSAAVITKIEDEAVELGVIELLEGFGHIAIGGFAERYQADVADAGLQHGVKLDSGAGNFAASNSDFDGLVPAFATERNVNHSTLGPLSISATSVPVRPSQDLPSTLRTMSPGRIPAL